MPATSGTSSGIQLPQLEGRLVHRSFQEPGQGEPFSSQIKLLATSKGSLQTRTDNLKKFEQSRHKKAEVDKLSAHWRTVSHLKNIWVVILRLHRACAIN